MAYLAKRKSPKGKRKGSRRILRRDPFRFRILCPYLCAQKLDIDNGLTVIAPHSMRHWSISLKLLLTGDVKAVQADSGQKNTQMVLDRYAHTFMEQRRKMAFTVEGNLNQLAENSQTIPKIQIVENTE